MQLDYLHSEDWAQLEELHPAAIAFLRGRALLREHEYLASIDKPNKHQLQRLGELRLLLRKVETHR